MDTRIALIGIIVEDTNGIAPTNALLHEYSTYIVGRMGIPYSKKGVNIISVVLDAPDHIISSLSGKLGRIPGISVKSMLAKTKA
jgi:putative iron-only hydrogenase system regulator